MNHRLDPARVAVGLRGRLSRFGSGLAAFALAALRASRRGRLAPGLEADPPVFLDTEATWRSR